MTAAAVWGVPVASWMLYGIFVSGVVTLAALAAQASLRAANRPLRVVWIAAIVGMMTLSIAVPFRERVRTSRSDAIVTKVQDRGAEREKARGRSAREWLAALPQAVASPMQRAIERLEELGSQVSPSVNRGLVVLWSGTSAAIFVLSLLGYRRIVRRVRRFPRVELAGVEVSVGSGIGPAVVGLAPSQIVVPRWLMTRPSHEQRMAIMHEVEHIRAADPWVLVVACGAATLMPWNPALWYALSRLRLAVEIDCDRRVLRRGISSVSYGTLLIDLSVLSRPLPALVPAFPGTTSHLERRLLAMTETTTRFKRVRRFAGGFIAATVLVGACETRLPTSAEVEAMDAEAVEKQVVTAGIFDATGAEFFVDGKSVTPAAARAIPASMIASVEGQKAARDRSAAIHITTVPVIAADSVVVVRPIDSVVVARPARARVSAEDQEAPARTFSGLLIIDGVITDGGALARLDPARIESVDVIKGAAAARSYSDPRARNGVIRVKTKR